jgi:hypothetical protein
MGDENTIWKTDGSPPPDTPTLTRIAELANMCSLDSLERIQNLLDSIQMQGCTTLNPISAKDLTLQKLICKCQTNDENSQCLLYLYDRQHPAGFSFGFVCSWLFYHWLSTNLNMSFSYKCSPKATFSLLEKDMGLTRRSLSDMSKRGQCLAFIACAGECAFLFCLNINRQSLSGTPYILLLIAVSGMARQFIHQSKMTHCHIPYIHTSLPDFGIQIRSGPILRSASDPIYDKLPKFISYSFNVITAYSFIR